MERICCNLNDIVFSAVLHTRLQNTKLENSNYSLADIHDHSECKILYLGVCDNWCGDYVDDGCYILVTCV